MRRAALLVAFLLVLWFTRALWLRPIGAALIHDDPPAKADLAIVLAGDPWGHRILKAAELARQGFVPVVLVSGPDVYGVHESDLAIAFAVRQGYSPGLFAGVPNSALSTREEARVMLQEAQRRNARSFLLVTSDYHTARAGRIYRAAERQMGGGPDFRVVAAPDEHFGAGIWWTSREGWKIAFTEWCKTIATAAGM